MTERLLVRTPAKETIFPSPFVWLKAWITTVGNSHMSWCYHARGLVDIEKLLAYKMQLHSLKWNESSSADWDQCPLHPPLQPKKLLWYFLVVHSREEYNKVVWWYTQGSLNNKANQNNLFYVYTNSNLIILLNYLLNRVCARRQLIDLQ